MNNFMDRNHFELEYEPNQQKSPFPYFKFNEETQLYESYEPLLDQDRVALLNAAWLGWQTAMKKSVIISVLKKKLMLLLRLRLKMLKNILRV